MLGKSVGDEMRDKLWLYLWGRLLWLPHTKTVAGLDHQRGHHQ